MLVTDRVSRMMTSTLALVAAVAIALGSGLSLFLVNRITS